MDKLWRQNELDLRLTPYRCVATWPMGGLLEIVKNAATTAQIQKRYGGSLLGALKDNTFLDWITEVLLAKPALEECVGRVIVTVGSRVGGRSLLHVVVLFLLYQSSV